MIAGGGNIVDIWSGFPIKKVARLKTVTESNKNEISNGSATFP